MVRQIKVLVLAMLAISCSKEAEQGPIPCATHDECLSAAGEFPERCAPRDWYCHDGACEVSCAQICEVASDDVNPCTDTTLICNEPQGSSIELPHCTGRPIECSSPADCPLFKPSDNGTWTCEGGVCQFPGFSYASEL